MIKNGIKQYIGIDIFKFIFSIGVVYIHTSLNRYYNPFIDTVVKLAVPFFFCAAGFFINMKIESGDNYKDILKKYIKNISKMYLMGTIIIFIININDFISAGNYLVEILKKIRVFLFIGDIHLWYLLYTIYACLAIMLFLKMNLRKENSSIGCISIICFFYINTKNKCGKQCILQGTLFNIRREKCFLTSSTLYCSWDEFKSTKAKNILLYNISFTLLCNNIFKYYW